MAANTQPAKLNTEAFKPSAEVIALSEQLQTVIGYNPISHAFKRANVISVVQQWVQHPEISDLIQRLENSPVGFMTDKDPGVFYPPVVRAQCVTDALANGLRLDGNEFNIISGKMMIVQAGWRRLCEEMGQDVPGGFSPDSVYQTQTLYCYDEGEPVIKNNIATIHMIIDAQLLNKAEKKIEAVRFERDISITIKSKDTVDAWIGKAERRMYRAFFRKYSGKMIPEADSADEFDGSATPQQQEIPPVGSKQKSSKVVVKKPAGEPNERPVTTRVDVEDGQYVESTPEANNVLNDVANSGGDVPDAPPEPPQQTTLLDAQPEETPKASAPKTNRPKTNF